MRPTFVHLIAGLGLGTALTVSLALPGRFVLAGQPHIQGLALPRSGDVVVEAAPLTQPAPGRRVVPRRTSVSVSSQGRQPHAVRDSYAPRPTPRPHSQRPQIAHRTAPVRRPAPSAPQTLQPLAVPSGTATDGEGKKAKKVKKPKKVKEPKNSKEREKVKEPKKVKTKPDKVSSKGEEKDKDEPKEGKKEDRGDERGHDKSRDE